MKQADEARFSAKMHELADMFNSMAKEPVAGSGCCPQGGQCYAVDPKAADAYNDRSAEIYAEFTQAGYSGDDWNDLMQRCGAGAKMGMGA